MNKKETIQLIAILIFAASAICLIACIYYSIIYSDMETFDKVFISSGITAILSVGFYTVAQGLNKP
jgi:hypothetical protein